MNDGDSDLFAVSRDPQAQRHEWFHQLGCEFVPERSERVTARETRMRALKPCPYCNPTRTRQEKLRTDGGTSGRYRPPDPDHSHRKPVCECDEPDPETLGEGTPVEFDVCQNCSGVVDD